MDADKEASVRQAIDHTVAIYLRELPSKVHTLLDKAVLSVLGLEQDRWNHQIINVDRCNGRNSVVSGFISKRVLALVQERIDPVVEAAIDAEIGQISPAVQRYAKELYERELSKAIREGAAARARSDADRILDSIAAVNAAPLVENTELADPDCYPGETGEVILEDLVEREIGPIFATSR